MVNISHKPTERSSYYPIIKYLEKIGFSGIDEISKDGEFPDILFSQNDSNYYIQVKVGDENKILEGAIAARDLKDVIVLIYPNSIRQSFISVKKDEWFDICLNTIADFLIFSDIWDEDVRQKGKPKDILLKFKQKLENYESSKNDVDNSIEIIKKSIEDLNNAFSELVPTEKSELSNEVIQNLELFIGLMEETLNEENKDIYQKISINIACYLLVNQFTFYHLYKRNTGKPDSILPELNSESKDIFTHLIDCYNKITNINYEAIYMINILRHVPKNAIMESALRNMLYNILMIPYKSLKYDLYGKLFHELIPENLRKIFAAFYTKPVAAEILARITNDNWNDTILDPACGSGSLLVSSYRSKISKYEELYEKISKKPNLSEIHKQFLEKDITGLDVMPFAIHITGLNLSSQNIQFDTNILRTAIVKDSLELSYHIDELEDGYKITPFKRIIKPTLDKYFSPPKLVNREIKKEKLKVGGITPNLEIVEFELTKVDRIIMNPPFTDREKMPEYFRNQLLNYTRLTARCGNNINLWGYFLALAHDLINENGQIGAVIPINFFRGSDTAKIRAFMFRNYFPKIIIKSVAERAFSEDSAYKDILIVFDKIKKGNRFSKLVFLKNRLSELSYFKAIKIDTLLRSLTEGSSYSDDLIDIISIPIDDFQKNMDNMMPLLHSTSGIIKKEIDSFWTEINKLTSETLIYLKEDDFKEGIGLRPAGLNEIVCITNSKDISRLRHAKLVVIKENSEDSDFVISFKRKEDSKSKSKKSKPLKIHKIKTDNTRLFLRTFTGFSTLNIENQLDYLIINEFKNMDELLQLSKIKPNKKTTKKQIVLKKMIQMKRKSDKIACNIAIPDKLDITSPNTHFISFFSNEKFVPNNMGYSIQLKYDNIDDYKIQALFFNSIIMIIQFLRYKSEALGITRMKKNDWEKIKILNIDLLSKPQKDSLISLYNEICNISFPSLLEQFESGYSYRKKLDIHFLNILGYDQDKIESRLDSLYKIVSTELKNFKKSLKMFN